MDPQHSAFLDPPDEFTPIPFWFWNDELTRPEILRQIHDFRAKGVMGFVLHPRIGIPPELPYLSDAFLDLVEVAVQEADDHGMLVFLYDEAMYPSGAAHGMVVQGNPEFASRGLRMEDHVWTESAEFSVGLQPGESLVSAQAVAWVGPDRIDPFRTQVLSPVNGKISFAAPDSGSWSVLVFIETYSGSVIRGIHFGEDDGEPNAPPSADLLNPAAVDKFIRLTHERYAERLARYFGTTIPAIFTDEPKPFAKRPKPGLRPWTGGSLDWYLAQGGQESDLPALWLDAGEDSQMARRRHERAVHRRLLETYYRPIAEWCSAHGLGLTGHPAESDNIAAQRYLHIPGQDLVLRWVAPEDGKALLGPHSTLGKCSADAARHYGRRRNLNECFGCCGRLGMGYSLTADDIKWYTDWLAVRGVNWFLPHAFYYSVRGPRRIGERPPDVGPHNIWWPYWHSIAQYMRRLSWLMTDSPNCAQIAVLCEGDRLPWAVVEPLYQGQWEFNYLEEALFLSEACTWQGDALAIADQRYRLLLVEEPGWLSDAARQKLAQIQACGAHVIYFDPAGSAGSLPGVISLARPGDLPALLARLLRPDVSIDPPCPDLRASHVVKEGYHYYLLVNEGEDPVIGALHLGVVGAAEMWDAWEGRITSCPAQASLDGHLELPLSLPRRASLIIRVDPCAVLAGDQTSCQAAPERLFSLDHQWRVSDAPTPVPPASILGSWTAWPGMAEYSGTLTYELEVEIAELPSAWAVLDLGQVGEIVALSVNGQSAGARLWAPYRFDITALLRRGSNRFRAEITNSLAVSIDKVPLPSGLIGPIVLSMA